MSYIHKFEGKGEIVLDQEFQIPFKTAYALADASGFGLVKLLADAVLTEDQLKKILDLDITSDEFNELIDGWSEHSEKAGKGSKK